MRNVLRHLQMLPGEPTPPRSRVIGKFIWFRASQDGWWQPTVAAGDEIVVGQHVGTLRTLYGDVIEELYAPRAGVVPSVTPSPAAGTAAPRLGLSAELSG